MLPQCLPVGEGPVPSTSTGGGPNLHIGDTNNDEKRQITSVNDAAEGTEMETEEEEEEEDVGPLVLEPITSGCRVCFMKSSGQCQPLICDRIKSGITCLDCKGVRDNPRFSQQPSGTVVQFTSLPHGLVKATKNFSWAVVRVVPQRLVASASETSSCPQDESGPLALLVMLLEARGCLVLCGSEETARCLNAQYKNCSKLLPFAVDYGRCTSHDTFYLDRCSRGKNRCSQQLPLDKVRRNLANFNGQLPEIRRRGHSQDRVDTPTLSARKRPRSPPLPSPLLSPLLPGAYAHSSLPPVRLPPPRLAIPSPSLSPAFAPSTSRWMPARLEWDAFQQKRKTFVLRQTFADPSAEIVAVFVRWPGFADRRLQFSSAHDSNDRLMQLQVEGVPHPLAPPATEQSQAGTEELYMALDAEIVVKERAGHNMGTTRIPLTYVYGLGGQGVLPGPNRFQYSLALRSSNSEVIKPLLKAMQKLPAGVKLADVIAAGKPLIYQASMWKPLKVALAFGQPRTKFTLSRSASDCSCPVAEVLLQVMSVKRTLRWSMKSACDLELELEPLLELGLHVPPAPADTTGFVSGTIVIRHLVTSDPKSPHFVERRLLVEYGAPMHRSDSASSSASAAASSNAELIASNQLRSLNISEIEKRFGPDSTEVADVVLRSAAFHGANANFNMQKKLLSRALRIIELQYGSGDVRVASVLVALACCRGALGDTIAQRDLLERALEIQNQALGSAHPALVPTMNTLALAYGLLGNTAKQNLMMDRIHKLSRK